MMNSQNASDQREIPDKKTVASLTSALKSCKLSRVSAQKMAIALSETFGGFPIVNRSFLKGSRVVRVRVNRAGETFGSERDLSYRPDLNNIHRYGRASVPLQSVFYGTIVSTTLVDAFSTVLCETSGIFRNMQIDTPEEFVFTIGYWTVTGDLKTSAIVFSKAFCRGDSDHQEFI
jgi:hypothetical protein